MEIKESNIIPSEWVKICKKKLNKINHCKPPVNYPVGKINLKKVQLVRSYFLFINRTKSTVFSFSPDVHRYWNVLLNKRIYLLDCIRTALDSDKRINKKEKKYLELTIKTLEKYDNRYGEKIILPLNRYFCNDIIRCICEFI
jgi:hypothetical protein